jgi:predicted glycosyltransferase
MNILVDIGHPAHVHLFRNFIKEAQKRGHSVVVYGRDKDCTLELLNAANIPVSGSTRARKSLVGKLFELFIRDRKINYLIRKHRIDVAMGTSASISRVRTCSGMKSYIFGEDDVENVPLYARLAYPKSTGVVAPRCVRMGRWKHKHIPYDGYQKLAYLHPDCFIPDVDIPKSYGLDPDDGYFLLRLTAFSAHHDIGHKGLSHHQILTLVRLLSERGRVLISSEVPLIGELENYRLDVPVEHIHHVMAFGRLFVGDSQSMATESALLVFMAYRCN